MHLWAMLYKAALFCHTNPQRNQGLAAAKTLGKARGMWVVGLMPVPGSIKPLARWEQVATGTSR